MKAVYFDGSLEIREMPAPVAGKGEIIIKTVLAGICRTDIELVKGYMNFKGVPGHEFVGIVEAAEDQTLIGRRVVGEINTGCGVCPACNEGMSRHCPDRKVLGIVGGTGAFAEKFALSAENIFTIPDDLPDEKAVFTEPVAACYEILEQMGIPEDVKLLVIGDGKLGMLAAQAMKDCGADVTVAGKHHSKMKLIEEKFGIKTVNSGAVGSELFDIVVECSGRPEGLELATASVRPRGTIVLKSTYSGKITFDTSIWVINEIEVIGSRCGRFGPAIKALSQGRVDPTPLIEKIFPFSGALEAFSEACRPGAMKVLLRVGE